MTRGSVSLSCATEQHPAFINLNSIKINYHTEISLNLSKKYWVMRLFKHMFNFMFDEIVQKTNQNITEKRLNHDNRSWYRFEKSNRSYI